MERKVLSFGEFSKQMNSPMPEESSSFKDLEIKEEEENEEDGEEKEEGEDAG
jgi:hypothetical protein